MRSTAIMSPTEFEVQKVRIEHEANEARMASDLGGLQTAIAKMAELLRSYYGPHVGN
jgi:hypothetical protein